MEMTEHKTQETVENQENEIASYLESSEYRVCEYPNGLVMGLRLQSIPGGKGVHADVVHVLDLRQAKFGKTALAVQSALLDTIDKDLRHLLEDVGIGSMFEIQQIYTPFGRAHLRVLRPPKASRGSMVYETRSVYVVHSRDRVPPSNVTWLSRSTRIVSVDEFNLLHQSDTRSSLHDVKGSIEQTKWKDLEAGYRSGWWSLLPLILMMASSVGVTASILTSSGTLLVPAAVAAVSAPLFAWLARTGAIRLDAFNAALDTEEAKLEKAGDLARIREEIRENEEKLRVVGRLSFVLTPLMGGAGVAVEEGDFSAAASSLSAILTECVVHAPELDDESGSSADLGLKKFIKLFLSLGV
ncbi:hypothetical protein EU545_05810, partial [Candidatus Thorarchaeota archaeon]